MLSQEDIDALYGAMCRERKGTKAYFERRSDWYAAQARFHMEALEAMKKLLQGTDTWKLAEQIRKLEDDVKHLKATQEEADKQNEKDVGKVEAERDEARNELDVLRESLGLSRMDYERAKAVGRLPSGQFLLE